MKKLFTLLFGVALITSAAFAQVYRHQDQQTNNGYQQSQYSRGQDSYNRGQGGNYREVQYANRDRDDRFHGGDRDDKFRGGDRDDHFRREQRYPVQYGNQRWDNDVRYQHSRPSILPALVGGVIIGALLAR